MFKMNMWNQLWLFSLILSFHPSVNHTDINQAVEWKAQWGCVVLLALLLSASLSLHKDCYEIGSWDCQGGPASVLRERCGRHWEDGWEPETGQSVQSKPGQGQQHSVPLYSLPPLFMCTHIWYVAGVGERRLSEHQLHHRRPAAGPHITVRPHRPAPVWGWRHEWVMRFSPFVHR